jgi:Flavodoxin-like fold
MMSTYGPATDVLAEQAKVLWCDLLIFQFPMWWFGMPGGVAPEVRKTYLDAFANRLQTLEEIMPLFFHPSEDYGPDQRLKPRVVARSGFQWNP